MKVALFLCLTGAAAVAQVVPTTPTKFGKRTIGGGSGSTEVSVSAPSPTERMVRLTSHIALSEARQWTSQDGRSLLGKLIAFEDLTTEVPQSQAATATMPRLTGKPTVIQDESARLLVQQTAHVIPLKQLSEADQAFVKQIHTAVAASQ
jgi:hypothetical protein